MALAHDKPVPVRARRACGVDVQDGQNQDGYDVSGRQVAPNVAEPGGVDYLEVSASYGARCSTEPP